MNRITNYTSENIKLIQNILCYCFCSYRWSFSNCTETAQTGIFSIIFVIYLVNQRLILYYIIKVTTSATFINSDQTLHIMSNFSENK